MAFLDNLSARMTNSMDISRLQNSLQAEEKLRADLIYQIGMHYFELHKEDPSEEYAGFVAQIKESQTRTEEAKAAIRTLKGLVLCPTCGAEMPYGIAFCTNCGGRMPAPPRPQAPAGSVFCPNCGQQLPAGSKFCFNCGSSIPEIQRPVPEAPAAPVAEAVAVEPAEPESTED